jgi:hypothetical protein
MIHRLWNAIQEFLEGGFERHSLTRDELEELSEIFWFLLENPDWSINVIRDLDNLPGFPLWAETRATFSSGEVAMVSATAPAPAPVPTPPSAPAHGLMDNFPWR